MKGRPYVRLLELEPLLGAELSGQQRVEAHRLAVAPVTTLAPGQWTAGELRRGPVLNGAAFCLIVEGLVAQHISACGRTATHLLGVGDLLVLSSYASQPFPTTRTFSAADVVRVAVLDQILPAVTRRWPAIAMALLAQTAEQQDRVAVQHVISHFPTADQRIVALLWHLADRWGYAEPEGVVVPLTLGHETLGRLVGGRRPTVSTALGRLADRALVVRRDDGTWLLAPASRTALNGPSAPGPTPKIHALGLDGRARPPH